MQTQSPAPVVAKQEILIDAPLETVWQLESDIAHWADWNPEISASALEGDLRPGTVLRWKAAGFSIAATLDVVEPPHRLIWTGKSFGSRAEDAWRFEATAQGGTRVIEQDSLWGWMPRLMSLFDRHWLDKALTKSLQALKAQAELNRP